MPDSQFGDYLHVLIRRRGYTMTEFATEAGINASSLSRIRNGRRMPRSLPVDRWAELLGCSPDELATLQELALLAQAPAELRQRLAATRSDLAEAEDRHDTVASQYGTYRHAQAYFDGYWLAYNYHFHDDGRLMRSLCHLQGDTASWLVMDGGRIHYSYTGQAEVLADKLFLRLAEDRGSSEYLQVTCDCLFDLQVPSFLYGLVTGISGRDVRHPVSRPCAARMLLFYVGRTADLARQDGLLDRLQACLGSLSPSAMQPLFPAWLGGDEHIRRGLQLRPREDLDAIALNMLDNRLAPGSSVLHGGFV